MFNIVNKPGRCEKKSILVYIILYHLLDLDDVYKI